MSRPAPHVLTEDGIDTKEAACGYCFITYNKSLGQCPECVAEGRPLGHTYADELEPTADEILSLLVRQGSGWLGPLGPRPLAAQHPSLA